MEKLLKHNVTLYISAIIILLIIYIVKFVPSTALWIGATGIIIFLLHLWIVLTMLFGGVIGYLSIDENWHGWRNIAVSSSYSLFLFATTYALAVNFILINLLNITVLPHLSMITYLVLAVSTYITGSQIRLRGKNAMVMIDRFSNIVFVLFLATFLLAMWTIVSEVTWL